MSTPVNLPELGESVTEGTVLKWLKQVGDEVAVDEPLLEISTDKVDTEIPSPVAGTLLEINVEEDETVEVGSQLCVIGEGGEAAEEAEEAPAEESQSDEQPAQDEAAGEDEGSSPESSSAESSSSETSSSADSGSGDSGSGDSGSGDSAAGGSGARTSVNLPELGESVTEGTILKWLKQVGDEVAVDEALLEISTDKVDTEIPSPVAGTLLEIKVDEDETVEVGAELAVIGDRAAQPAEATEKSQPQPAEATEKTQSQPAEATEKSQPQPAEATEKSEPEPAEEEAQPEPAKAEPAAAAANPEPEHKPATSAGDKSDAAQYVTPLVRKMAAEHGVDLGSVKGSGVGGRIRKQDVLDAAERAKAPAAAAPAAATPAPAAAAPAATPSPLRGKTEPLSRLRKVIASRMVSSLQTSAQLTQVVEVDVTNVARMREGAKADFLAREGVKLTYLPFFAKAAVDALKVHPKLNANINDEKGEVTYFDRENIAFAVDTEKGLLTPVVKDAGDLSIAGLAKKIADVAERTRNNKIGPDDLSGGTFTITNLGSVGALWDTPILNQPQVAILGPGAVVKRAVVIDDPNLGETIAVRHMVYLALTYDHRLVDGADAGRFLQDVKARLEAAHFDI